MTDPANTRTRTPRPPRRPRPVAPPLDLVAIAALDLDPSSPVAVYLRSVPQIESRTRRLAALRLFDQLAPELGVTEAERLAALRFSMSTRQLRRWRRGL